MLYLYAVIILLFFPIMHADSKEGSIKNRQEEIEIPVTEDLMREHGVLNRILLIYDEIIKRINNKKDFPLHALKDAITIIQSFVENYHEKMEEDFLFPLFEKHKREVRLVRALKKQHDKGKEITAHLLIIIDSKKTVSLKEKQTIKKLLSQFITMYRPHEAREDTIIFPLVRTLVSEAEFKEIGEKCDILEHTLFGEDGFEKMVAKVAMLEKSLGIYEIESFTPRSSKK